MTAATMISPAAFAAEIGVSKQAVSKAIKVGRVPVYDASGAPVAPDAPGRKFVKADEAASKFTLSRARIDDAALAAAAADLEREIDPVAALSASPAPPAPSGEAFAPGTLVSAKTDKEKLQAELLRMRLARERGELVSRAAQQDALETAGRAVSRVAMSFSSWAEELNGLAHSGGVPAVAAFLRQKGYEFCSGVADLLTEAAAEKADDDGEPGSDDVS